MRDACDFVLLILFCFVVLYLLPSSPRFFVSFQLKTSHKEYILHSLFSLSLDLLLPSLSTYRTVPVRVSRNTTDIIQGTLLEQKITVHGNEIQQYFQVYIHTIIIPMLQKFSSRVLYFLWLLSLLLPLPPHPGCALSGSR